MPGTGESRTKVWNGKMGDWLKLADYQAIPWQKADRLLCELILI